MPVTLIENQDERIVEAGARFRRVPRRSGALEDSSFGDTNTVRVKETTFQEQLAKTSLMTPLNAAREIYPEEEAALIIDNKVRGMNDFMQILFSRESLLGALLLRSIQDGSVDNLSRAGVSYEAFLQRVLLVFNQDMAPRFKKMLAERESGEISLSDQITNAAYIKGALAIPAALDRRMDFVNAHTKAEIFFTALTEPAARDKLSSEDRVRLEGLFAEKVDSKPVDPISNNTDLYDLARLSIERDVYAQYEKSIEKTDDYDKKKNLDTERSLEISGRESPSWTQFSATIQGLICGGISAVNVIYMYQMGIAKGPLALALLGGLGAAYYFMRLADGVQYQEELDNRVEELKKNPKMIKQLKKIEN